jgi:aerobic carbon-monoxide dehydrogenase medium subunit
MLNPHPGLPEFDYIKPASLEEASQFLANHPGEARPFLGGTDCFVRMRDGFMQPKYMVDVKGLDGTKELAFHPENGLTIGAAVSMNRVAAMPEVKNCYPVLEEAIRSVASYQLRSRATIVGNICNASPAGDTIGSCLVFDATLNVHGVNGDRVVPLATFFRGPGKSVLEPGDIVTSITLPIPPDGSVGKFVKLGRNKIGDLSIIAVTALGYPDPSVPSNFRFRLALASVAPVPFVPVMVETILTEKPITDDTIAQAAQAAMDACTPIDDVRGSARYRKQMVRNLSRQALMDVWNRLHG